MKLSRYIPLFLLAVVSSCTDTVDLDLADSQVVRLVVEGGISDSESAEILLSTTTSNYFDQGSAPQLENATVNIYEDGTLATTLSEESPGVYRSAFVGQQGSAYSIEIIIPENNGTRLGASTYISDPTTINPVPPIDSTYCQFEDNRNEPGAEEEDIGYYGYFATTFFAEKGNFYRWKQYINDEYVNDPEYIFVRSDEFLQKLVWTDFPINFDPAELGDTVRMEQLSISEEAFEYYNLLAVQLTQQGSLFSPPASPIAGNVYLQGNRNYYALGFFDIEGMAVAELVLGNCIE